MKIRCPYCDSMFNDTLENCPNCGAPNAGVVRKSGNQPTTIAELQQWYSDRGLPSYEVTRFFIGIDYKKPRAFGIYKDSRTGNFVVYKNKDSGQRAVRYEGTDEAYAVNEIYQRLKQEILQQKRANVNRNGRNSASVRPSHELSSRQIAKILKIAKRWFLTLVLIPVAVMVLGVIALIAADEPEDGYYEYENTYYYATEASVSGKSGVNSKYWFSYNENSEDWDGILSESLVPDTLEKNKTAKAYYLSEEWTSGAVFPDFRNSVAYGDLANSFSVPTGYYAYEDNYYYHLNNDRYYGWYYYDNDDLDWREVSYDYIPEDLTHSTVADDFYYTPTWDSSTQISDFTDSVVYQDYQEELERAREEAEQSTWDDDDDDDNWDWDSGDDDWDWDDTDWDSDW